MKIGHPLAFSYYHTRGCFQLQFRGMRALSRLPRGFPANTHVLHRRPTLPQPVVCQRSRVARLNSSSSSGNDREKRGDAAKPEPPTDSSNPWTASRTLLVSALAAGLSYAYATLNNKPQPESLKQPQYGSTEDLKKVGAFTDLLFDVYAAVYKRCVWLMIPVPLGHCRIKSQVGR